MKTKETEQSILQKIRPRRVLYPILIGLAIIAFLFYKEFDPDVFRNNSVHFTWHSAMWLSLAFVCIFIRDIGYMFRLRVLSDYRLNWRQAFRIIMLWEFTTAVMPSAAGGTSVAVIFVHKEGISLGRSSTIIMLTALFDELYFILMFPLLIAIIGPSTLFNIAGSPAWSQGIFTAVIIGYLLKLAWFLLLCFGLFISPRKFSRFIYLLFHLPFLKRWKRAAGKVASDITTASAEIKLKKFSFWWQAFISSFIAWTSRYWIVNFLFMAFFTVNEHFLLFARQLVMSIVLLVSPTPGGSGVAEVMFTQYLGEFIPIASFAAILALLWRLITYYPYLTAGAILFPKWLNEKFEKRDVS